MDFYVYILIGLLVFVGFAVRVVTGFGSALILAPLLSLVLGPKQAVVYIILLECAIAIVFLVNEKLNFELWHIYIGGISGIIAGILAFGLVAQRILGFLVGLSVLSVSILFLLNVQFRVAKEGLLFTSLGFLSGSMGVLTGINGPQIVLGLVNQGYDARFIRGCMITYLIVIDFITLASFALAGYITAHVVILLGYASPFLLLSYAAGAYILKFIDPEKLKRLILLITLFAGALAIWNFLPWR